MTARNGPWRLLVLDREPDDPKWALATVKRADHVRPADLDEVGRYTNWPEITGWVRAQLGGMPAELTPVPEPLAWRIELPGEPAVTPGDELAGYLAAVRTLDVALDDALASIRAGQDTGDLDTVQAATARVSALEAHLAGVAALRAQHFGEPDPDATDPGTGVLS